MTLPRNPVIVIPARLAATRLPGKPLADIAGSAMIVHVWRRAVEAAVGPVVVACAEAEIAAVVRAAGGRAVLTWPDCASGSDRVFEAVEAIDPDRAHDAVVNLQGDLPTIDPAAIRAVLTPFADPDVDIATVAAVITDAAERDDPNVVKAVAAFAGCRPGNRPRPLFQRHRCLRRWAPIIHQPLAPAVALAASSACRQALEQHERQSVTRARSQMRTTALVTQLRARRCSADLARLPSCPKPR
jgi:CTP:molybdopterin cytidylyltransferase MocA